MNSRHRHSRRSSRQLTKLNVVNYVRKFTPVLKLVWSFWCIKVFFFLFSFVSELLAQFCIASQFWPNILIYAWGRHVELICFNCDGLTFWGKIDPQREQAKLETFSNWIRWYVCRRELVDVDYENLLNEVSIEDMQWQWAEIQEQN